MKIKCARCGKEINEKKHLLQLFTYLGDCSKRMDICSDCFAKLNSWLNEFKKGEMGND